MDVVKNSFHCRFSQQSLVQDAEGRTLKNHQKQAVSSGTPSTLAPCFTGRFQRKVISARAKDANGREEVDVVVIGARVADQTWLDAESQHTPEVVSMQPPKWQYLQYYNILHNITILTI